MKRETKKIWVAMTGERWDSDRVRVEFESPEDMRCWAKAMQGVIKIYDSWSEIVKR